MGRAGRRHIHWVLSALFLAAASSASADPEKCQRTIGKASVKFAKDKSKALQKCEDKKAKGDLPASTVCLTESKTLDSIQKAEAKLATSVTKDCGGRDKTCGTADDDSLASIGWDGVAACPNFENGSCNGAIDDCSDIVTCLTCVNEAAVDQAIDLYYDDLDEGQFGSNTPANKCQRAIGKETTKFLQSKQKALQKCWDERIKGKHGNACPTPGDGKAGPAIEKAEQKKIAAICKACGGADKACGGGDDLTPGQIGFASSCPDVTVPEGGSSCGGAIVDLPDVVQCVDCVTEFKVDCMDRLTVPQFVPYPPECNGASPTTTTTSSSTTTSTTQPGTCGNGVVDPGEPCDPSSPGGAFTCAPGEVCSETCTCESTTTTTAAPSTTTSTSTSSTTSTSIIGTCGNGMVDPGEPCDPSSPGGAFTCAPCEVCSASCTCESTTTTTTPTTTTTLVDNCGNGMVDPGEPCDPSSPGGAFTCAPGEVCSASCTCESTTTTTSSTTTTTLDTCGNGMVDPGEPCDASSPGGAFLCEPGEQCSAGCTCEPIPTTTSVPPTTLPPTTSSTDTTTSTTSSTSQSSSTSTSSSTSSTTTTLVYGSPSQAFVTRSVTLLE